MMAMMAMTVAVVIIVVTATMVRPMVMVSLSTPSLSRGAMSHSRMWTRRARGHGGPVPWEFFTKWSEVIGLLEVPFLP